VSFRASMLPQAHPASPRAAHARTTLIFAAIALLSLAGVGLALLAQYRFDMPPCPWCILQRVIYLLIAAVCLVGLLLRSRRVRKVLAGITLLLTLAGVASAVYQNVVASKLYSCNLTLADKILNALQLETLWPSVMAVTASCADAAVSVLGVPFEFWSLGLYALLGLLAMAVLVRR
jgi:protein dithiol:quinone oxidoreductase